MSDRDILVVYYSISGNTERVARDLARMLGADIERIRDDSRRAGFSGYFRAAVDAVRGATVDIGALERNPADYALTVVGTPVWAWRMTPAVKTYLRRFQNQFRNVAFFVTSGDTNPDKITPAMEELAGRKAIATAGFNTHELRDPHVYDAKLVGLARALGSSPVTGSLSVPVRKAP